MIQFIVNVKFVLGMVEFVMFMVFMMLLVVLSIDVMLFVFDVIGYYLGVKDIYESYFIVLLFFGGMVFGQLFFGFYCDVCG